ncbi:MAG TPA: helix-turn-helix transcriptional regulator [Gemmatimonadaceae bacterium]|nr:helix-turn-helix transcriptional regulator [Gemmatimonadaceae bacterium]
MPNTRGDALLGPLRIGVPPTRLAQPVRLVGGTNPQGKLIRSAREALGTARPEFAKAAGFSVSYLRKIEDGRKIITSDDTGRRVALLLGIDYDALFTCVHRIPPDLVEWLQRHPEAVKSLRLFKTRMDTIAAAKEDTTR